MKMTRSAFPDFLNEEKARHLHGEVNFQYPVNPAVLVSEAPASWGRFKPDYLPIKRLAIRATRAQMIIERVEW